MTFECKIQNGEEKGVILFGLTSRHSKTAPGWNMGSVGYKVCESSGGFIYKDGKEYASAPIVKIGDVVGCRLRYSTTDDEFTAFCTFTKNDEDVTKEIPMSTFDDLKFYPAVASSLSGLELDVNITYNPYRLQYSWIYSARF